MIIAVMDSSTVQDHANLNKAADNISEEFGDWYNSDEVCQGNNETDVSDFDRLFHASDEGNDNIELNENTADENKDSSEDGYDGESVEDYREIVSKVFSSELEGYHFYLDYAKKRGFGVRKDNLKYNRDDLPVYRKFCCSFAGFKRQREAKIREPRPSKRVGCPALLTIRFDSHAGIWYVNNFIEKHNHKMATTKDKLNPQI